MKTVKEEAWIKLGQLEADLWGVMINSDRDDVLKNKNFITDVCLSAHVFRRAIEDGKADKIKKALYTFLPEYFNPQ